MNPTSKSPLFLLGCPRSGTTMLSELLASTKWGSPVETHFITRYYDEAIRIDLSDRNAFRSLVGKILKMRAVMQWNLKVDIDAIYNSLPTKDYSSLVNAICMIRARNEGLANWGDKTPNYSLRIDVIHELFPTAKILFIVRDGRDVAASLLNREWGPNNIWSAANYWAKCNRTCPIIEQREAAGLWLKVKYEDLLDDPNTHLRRVYEFLGHEADDAAVEQTVTAVRANNHTKWKTTLTPSQIRVFEQTAGKTLQRLGYATTHQPTDVNPMLKSAFWMHERIAHGQFLFKANVIDTFKIHVLGHVF